MPWARAIDPDRGLDTELIIARLSYHIDRRCADRKVCNQIIEIARIDATTLRNYRRHEDVLNGTKNKLVGPRKLSVFLQVCAAMGDNPGLVLYAAMHSESYTAMVRLLESDLFAVVRVGFGDAPDQQVTVPLGVSSMRRDLEDPRISPVV
jgi:hypothetical protein